ncbi:MAG: PQQ-dependent sugar dehydrogenase [Gemmatimonadota bacterium]
MKGAPRLAVVVLLALAVGWGLNRTVRAYFFGASDPEGLARGATAAGLQGLQVLATGLEAPWEIAFLLDGDFLVTERPGRISRLGPDGDRRRSYTVPGVRAVGEGGLMGLALDPDFAGNGWIYVMLTGDGSDGDLENRVERYRLGDQSLQDRTVVLDGIPGARFHDGGRIAFGPDGYLYVTTGDATDSERAQNRGSVAGKILRITRDGRPAPGNPFGDEIYSWGHRNAQGLAWDAEGRLWATEHGRSGMRTGLDELNRIEAGANYGWPVIEGDETSDGMVAPVVHSGPDLTWAPAALAHLDGRLFFGGLRGEALYEVRIRGNDVTEPQVHFFRDFGRIRVVRIGPDGMLYLATSNRDGRGQVRDGDDRILQVDPASLP